MQTTAQRWEITYNQVPLCNVLGHFAGMRNSPFQLQYLTTVLHLCPRGGRTLETGIGAGYGAIWLSQRGIKASGIDYSAGIVERSRLVNNILEGKAEFHFGDLFDLYENEAHSPRYNVVHHQGVLEHFTVPMIHAALAQQVAISDYVVVSCPSSFYPFDPEFGDERMMPISEWERILQPFDIVELKYYGDPNLGAQEQIMFTLRGQEVTDDLLALMQAHKQPYPEGISAIVHTRNEERHIGECLSTLKNWTDEIIVCDMESDDRTIEIAGQFTDNILPHPRITNFDRARNVSAMRAKYRWVVYLDADERVPATLGNQLRHLTQTSGDSFDAMLLPMRHYFAGHWLKSLYPGYTAPRLLKNGKFSFRARLHSGAEVDGNVIAFPADNPDLAIAHLSFETMSQYMDKLNRYTEGESSNMYRDGHPFHWQNAISHFVQDFKSYYESGHATIDGVHGFIYAFQSGFYRFEQHAKLYERRFHGNNLQDEERQIPETVEQVLEYALAVARQKPRPRAPEIRVDAGHPQAASTVWSGPLLDPAGYGEESRHLLFALDDALRQAPPVLGAGGQSGVSALAIPWSDDVAPLKGADRKRLQDLCDKPALPGFVQIVHNFAPMFTRHRAASIAIGRTMFETDRLPLDWVKACEQMDYIWVPSEFNRQTFIDAGVNPKKLAVVPECLDPIPYSQQSNLSEPPATVRNIKECSACKFLTIFDWTRHKGWDVLLKAFVEEFRGDEDIKLYFKVWSTNGYSNEDILAQAAAFCEENLNYNLLGDSRIEFIFERFPEDSLIELYRSVDCYVMPSRGEGWGRPYMEAMAAGLPVIGTNWSGNTAFMNADNSYLIDYDLLPVLEFAWREVHTYRGHRWAEPRLDHLKQLLRRVYGYPEEAQAVGLRGQSHIQQNLSREAVGPIIAKEIERVHRERELQAIVSVLGGKSSTSEELQPAALISVQWEGAFFRWHSLAHVNRELCLGLIEAGGVDLSIVSTEPNDFNPSDVPTFLPLAERTFAPLAKPVGVYVAHRFPPRLTPPDHGHFVLMQPWEYGYIPKHWVTPILEHVSEVWCNSTYVRDVYLNSGIPESKLKLIPLGADTSVFRPSAPPYVFTTEPGSNVHSHISLQGDPRPPLTPPLREGEQEPFTFLFVGGTLHRKGIDVLLDAYLKAFSAYDDVVLVIKDTCTNTVYQGQNERERILGLCNDPTRPMIVYLEEDFPPHQLAGLYTAADCLVQPYRGEGFCLPVIEAMACGVPAIVPEGGPTDDFVDDTVGYRIPATRKPFGNGRIGDWECAGPTWMFEVDPRVLANEMREVFHNRQAALEKGAAAAKRAAESWTWRHSAAAITERLRELQSQPSTRSIPLSNHSDISRAELADAAAVAAFTVTDKRSKSRSKSKSQNLRPKAAAHWPTISLCMIGKNEERVVGACLESIKPWVDEIIFVDTGSTDRTGEIAESHGVKLYHFPWTDSFSEARNESLSHATSDWLLWMDCDDTIPEECGKRLHDLVLMAEDKITGIMMQVNIPPAKGEVGFTVVDHVKLFRNHLGLRFEGHIHEQILEPIYRIGGMVERSDLYVVHSGYDYSPEGQKNKRARDLKLLEKDLRERPDHPFVLFNIGMTAFYLKDYDRAIQALERCLAVSKPMESTLRKVFAMLSGCSLEQNDLPKAKEWVDRGLGSFPHDPELLFRAGIIYRDVGDLEAAANSYVKLLTNREVGHIDSLDVTMAGFKAHHNLALIYQDMHRWDDAIRHWQLATDNEPTFLPSWVALGELALHIQRYDIAERVLPKLKELNPMEAQRLAHGLMMAAAGSRAIG